jgi:hypothetical protein
MIRLALAASLVFVAAPALASPTRPSLGLPALTLRGGGEAEAAPFVAVAPSAVSADSGIRLQLDAGGGAEEGGTKEDALWSDIGLGGGLLLGGILLLALLPDGGLGPLPILLIVGGGVYLVLAIALSF